MEALLADKQKHLQLCRNAAKRAPEDSVGIPAAATLSRLNCTLRTSIAEPLREENFSTKSDEEKLHYLVRNQNAD